MPTTFLILLFACGMGFVVAAERAPVHAAALEWCGGLLLASGFVGLGLALARSAG